MTTCFPRWRGGGIDACMSDDQKTTVISLPRRGRKSTLSRGQLKRWCSWDPSHLDRILRLVEAFSHGSAIILCADGRRVAGELR